MVLTASTLRQDIYRVLDLVLDTGEPVHIERNGRRLMIVAEEPMAKLDRLVGRTDAVKGDSDDFVHLDWSHEWKA